MNSKLPFTVIGGYLGAGKTTLLNHLLTNTQGMRIAALVNDFGSVNIDAALIRSHEGDTINLANGCMCCSIRDNFAMTIDHIRKRAADFDRIVIEASGVADPVKIAQYGQMYQLPLDGILVMADAEQVRTQAQNKYVGDTVIRQFAQADLIILNKIDLISAPDLAELQDWFTQLAPGTPVINVVQSRVPINILLGSHRGHAVEDVPREDISVDAADPHAHHAQDHRHTFETWMLERAEPVSREALEQFARGLGTEIYRAKGFVYLQEDPTHRYIYQQVGARWSLEPDVAWHDAPQTQLPQTQLVVIGRSGAADLESLASLLNQPSLNQQILSRHF
jgi:G3E family GTPase